MRQKSIVRRFVKDTMIPLANVVIKIQTTCEVKWILF